MIRAITNQANVRMNPTVTDYYEIDQILKSPSIMRLHPRTNTVLVVTKTLHFYASSIVTHSKVHTIKARFIWSAKVSKSNAFAYFSILKLAYATLK